MRAVDFHIIVLNTESRFYPVRLAVNLLRFGKKNRDIIALKSSVRSEKFQSVPFPRVMACSDLDGTVAFEIKY